MRSHKMTLHHIEQLAHKALAHWGMTGSLSLIKQRENSVFKLETAHNKYVLRVHRQGYHSDAALMSEHQWLMALNESGLHAPKAVPTLDGKPFVTESTEAIPIPRQIDIMVWVDGEQMGSIEEGLGKDAASIEPIFSTIGRTAAAVHNQAENWQLPEGFTRHAWDIEGLLGDNPCWGPFWKLPRLTDEQLALIHSARHALQEDLRTFGKTANNYGLIHADLVPENLMVADDKVEMIDFDDSGFGWHMFEIATVLYFIQDDPNFDVAKSSLVSGYREVRGLSAGDENTLSMFLAARSLTYLGWIYERPDSAEAQQMRDFLIDTCCETIKPYLSARP